MGLFVSNDTNKTVDYNIGTKNMQVIIGLGNPGKKYDDTRHNIGFICVDALKTSQSEFGAWQEKKDLHAQISSGNFGQTKVILVKPTTYMNESGQAVQAVMNFYKLSPKSLTVVHDELDLTFGQIRTRVGGGSAGHNGIKSVTQHIGNEYGRIRIGIDSSSRPEQQDTSDYVLAKFSKEEQGNIKLVQREVQSLLIELIYRGELYPETRNAII